MQGGQALLNAQTRVAGVIGDPVGHSLSPVIHNAAISAMGINWTYVAFPVAAGLGGEAVVAMRVLGIAGLSVTMPHKAAVALAVDRLTPTASRLGVANTVSRQGIELVGDATDGPGFVDALCQDEGWDPRGRHCVVLGSGAAARAVTLALAEAGARAVGIVGRRIHAASECAALAGSRGRVVLASEAAAADLVVNATPVGMASPVSGPGGQLLPFDLDPAWLSAGQLVADMIYSPSETALLSAARVRGARTVNGVGMLVHQAARQLELWTGDRVPTEVMAQAARRYLAASS